MRVSTNARRVPFRLIQKLETVFEGAPCQVNLSNIFQGAQYLFVCKCAVLDDLIEISKCSLEFAAHEMNVTQVA